jgi:hypothetical protein
VITINIKGKAMQDTISVKGLHDALNENGYICNPSFVSRIATSIHAKPVGGAFLYGPAGTGKSMLPQVLAEILERKLFFHQCSAGTREDDLLMRIWPNEDTKSGVKIEYGKIYEASKASQSEEVIVVLDEWDKTKPSADGFFLDFLQYGRLSVPGGDAVLAKLENMTIFFTANDDRDFSEALLRRFPKVDLTPLPPLLVNQALRETHEKNVFRPNAVSLYQKCLMAEMPKPATIQELRQLLDAIEYLGAGADWDTLVFQYITKTDENHSLLRNVENGDWDDFKQEQREKLSPEAYQQVFGAEDDSDGNAIKMPELSNIRGFDSSFDTAQGIPESDDIYGVITRDDDSYSAVTEVEDELPEEAQFLSWAEVRDDCIIAKKPIDLTAAHELMDRFSRTKVKGELVFTTDDISLEEIRRLIRGKYIKHKYSAKEIIAREIYNRGEKSECKVDIRWKEGKTEIIVPIKNMGRIDDAMNMNAKHNLIMLPEIRKYRGICFSPLVSVRDVAPYFLRDVRPQDTVGNIILKNMKRTNGLCQMLKPETPEKYGDIDISQRINSMKDKRVKFDYVSIPDAKIISARGIDVKLISLGSNTGNDGNDCVLVQIDTAPEPNVFKFALWCTGFLPLYKCFKTNTKETMLEMQKRGWLVSQDNMDALEKDSMRCLFVFDHMIVWRQFWSSDWLGARNDMLTNAIKSTTTRINALTKKYEIQD